MLEINKYPDGKFYSTDTAPILDPNNGCSFWRIVLPFSYGGMNLTEAKEKDVSYYFERAKSITFNRQPGFGDAWKQIIQAKLYYGWKIIYDIDDYWHLNPRHLLKSMYETNQLPKMYEETIRTMEASTTTTQRLAEKMKELNSEIYVIPNAVPFDQESEFRYIPRKLSKDVRFGFVGGSTHQYDLATVKEIFEIPRFNFTLSGYDVRGLKPNEIRNSSWYYMEQLASNNWKNSHYRRINTKPLSEYMTSYDEIDVAIAPLVDNFFNSCKSELKLIEAGSKGILVIASNLPPFSDVQAEGVTLCKSKHDWKKAIKKFKNDPDLAVSEGLKLREWVWRNRNLATVNSYRGFVYDHINSGGKSADFPTYEQFLNEKAKDLRIEGQEIHSTPIG